MMGRYVNTPALPALVSSVSPVFAEGLGGAAAKCQSGAAEFAGSEVLIMLPDAGSAEGGTGTTGRKMAVCGRSRMNRGTGGTGRS